MDWLLQETSQNTQWRSGESAFNTQTSSLQSKILSFAPTTLESVRKWTQEAITSEIQGSMCEERRFRCEEVTRFHGVAKYAYSYPKGKAISCNHEFMLWRILGSEGIEIEKKRVMIDRWFSVSGELLQVGLTFSYDSSSHHDICGWNTNTNSSFVV